MDASHGKRAPAATATKPRAPCGAKRTPKTERPHDSNPFIMITTPSAKIDAAARRQIRSHVMRGKNRKRVDPERNVALGSWINGCQAPPAAPVKMPDRVVIPRRVGTEISHFQLVDAVDPHRTELVFTWFSVIKQNMYPIEAVIQPPADPWLDYLAYDRAYLQCVLFASQSFLDWRREGRIGELSFQHLNAAMQSLRQNLAKDDHTALTASDSTMAVVVTLSMMAEVLHDGTAAGNHLEALFHLVQMRGGIHAVQHNPQLQTKILRADLGRAISTGSKPLFFSDGFSWDSYLAPQSRTPSLAAASKHTIFHVLSRANETPDQRLVNIYLDLLEFSLGADIAYQTGKKIEFDPFLETLVSAQYRLLALRDEHLESEHTTGTIVTLGMLAFTTTTFLQVQGLPVNYDDLARRLRGHLVAFQQADIEEGAELTRLKLWFLFMAAISVLTEPEDEGLLLGVAGQLLARIGMASASWDNVRDVLREHIWVDWLHMPCGQIFFGKIIAQNNLLR